MELKDFKSGQWVRLHPASDWFMRGVVYATVRTVGRKYLTLDWTDGNGHWVKVKIHPRDILDIL